MEQFKFTDCLKTVDDVIKMLQDVTPAEYETAINNAIIALKAIKDIEFKRAIKPYEKMLNDIRSCYINPDSYLPYLPYSPRRRAFDDIDWPTNPIKPRIPPIFRPLLEPKRTPVFLPPKQQLNEFLNKYPKHKAELNRLVDQWFESITTQGDQSYIFTSDLVYVTTYNKDGVTHLKAEFYLEGLFVRVKFVVAPIVNEVLSFETIVPTETVVKSEDEND